MPGAQQLSPQAAAPPGHCATQRPLLQAEPAWQQSLPQATGRLAGHTQALPLQPPERQQEAPQPSG